MTDVEDKLARALLLADKPDELAHPVRVERGGRFVVDDDAGLGGRALGDLDQMLLGEGKIAAQDVDVDVESEAIEHRAGPPPHRGSVDEAEPSRLPAEVDVLRNGQVGKQRELLEDRGDARRARLRRAAEADFATVEGDLAGIGRIDPGE